MAVQPKLRVLLADDHAILREGLAMLINAQPDMEVAAQARDGSEAVTLAQQIQPDIAVLDVSMPIMGGAEATQQIRAFCPTTRVLALTRHAEPGYVRQMLQAGATGYVVKRSVGETLITAIRALAEGKSFVEPAVAGSMLRRAFQPLAPVGVAPEVHEGGLTLREEEVLRAVAWGLSNKEIAADLGLSIKTVESYKAGALDKLSLRSRADIVRYALRRGWLSEDSAPE